MATFTLTVALNANDYRQTAPRVTEALRQAADQLVNFTATSQSAAPTPYTKTDGYGNTAYSWTIA